MDLSLVCNSCKEEITYDFDFTKEQVDEWMMGGLIQDVMPQLTPSERDVFVLNMCIDCQDAMWDRMKQYEDL